MRLLDLFCGAGGAAMGYSRAGFDVVGVDIERQPHYPFLYYQGDVMQMKEVRGFDLVHASPPCQSYSLAMRHLAHAQPKLIDPLREMLKASGIPYIIENVPGAPLVHASNLFGEHGVVLCGSMFGLRIWRHRLFETSFPVDAPGDCDHSQPAMNPHNSLGRERIYTEFGKQDPDPIWNAEMGVLWMGRYEAREAIPPAYTEHLGRQFLAHLGIQGDEVRVSGIVLNGGVEHPTDEGEFGSGEGHGGSFRLTPDDLTKPAFNVKGRS